MTAPRVILVRHGTTAFNADTPGPERLRGWADVPLVAKGVAQGEAIAAKLAAFPADRLFSSDLKRALDTGQIVQRAQPGKPDLNPAYDLRPWNVGSWSGQEVETILPQMYEHMFNLPDNPAPDGESFNSFLIRFISFFQACLGLAAVNKYTLICATHTRNLRSADAWYAAGMQDDLLAVDKQVIWNPKHIEPGGALIFTLSNGSWRRSCIELNNSGPSTAVAS